MDWFWINLYKFNKKQLEVINEKNINEDFFKTFFDDLKAFCMEKVKTDEFSAVSPVLQNNNKRPETGKNPNISKNAKNVEVLAPIAGIDGVKIDLKLKLGERIHVLTSLAKEFICNSIGTFQENVSKLDVLTKNVYKSEFQMIKSICLYIAKKIEKEEKIEHSVQMQKFKYLINKDHLNYVIEKPPSLFNLELVDWKKFD